MRAQAILPPTADGIHKAAHLLTHGKLVVLPTETVYGIALNLASDPARDAARHIKARASENAAAPVPWVIHVAQIDDLLAWTPNLSALGRRLVTKSLPGPVAFQIKLDAAAEKAARKRLGAAADETLHEGFLTLRCPELPATQDVLAAVYDPVAIIGAGNRAQPAVFEIAELPAALFAPPGAAALAAALDGGPTRYRRSSTLVRVEGDHYAITRQGVIDERIIQRMADLTILFLCSGNTCRSPMAAAIATRLLADRLKIPPADLPLRHVVVQSAGLHATRGMHATPEAIEAVQSFGGDLSGHLSQTAMAEGGGLLRRADVIYTMTSAHRDEVLDLFPWAERKTFRLDPEGDIADPIGASLAVYQRVARRLASVIKDRLNELPT
jgi:protein-tyrosine-phosphatase/tRNA A37 threonylcarbamoyladenosine synthetase subunit TsaC/SUA5/YrdC